MKLTEDLKARTRKISFSMVPFDAWILVETLKQLPADTVIVAMAQDHLAMRWALLVISEKFQKVTEGSLCPEILPKIDGVNKKVELAMPVGPESFLNELGDL